MSNFTTPLIVEFIRPGVWKLIEEFDFHIGGSKYSPEVIHCPAGMLTDFASIPRIFWNILPPAGAYGKAAVLHDHLYQSEGIAARGGINIGAPLYTRKQSDGILLEAMQVLGVGWLTRQTIYHGVRLGGQSAWNKDREKALTTLVDATIAI